MKIAIADNTGFKFTRDLINYWTSKGHEVKAEPGASEHLAQWADVYWVDFWDNNIHYLWKLYNGDEDKNRTPDWDNNKKPLMVCRAVDWEVWIGFARDQRIIDWVDKSICIAPHIEEKLRREGDWKNLKLIRPGVNLDKFTLKTKQTDGFQLGMVLGDLWWYKNHMGGLDIFKTLYDEDNRWRLHIRGQHEAGEYNKVMFEHYLESRGIKDVVTLHQRVEDMNKWYEDIDILLHPGMKETFVYAVAEARAKGIPAVVNTFFGSDRIWDSESCLYTTHSEAVNMIQNLNKIIRIPGQRESIAAVERQYMKDNHSFEKMVKEIDEYLGL